MHTHVICAIILVFLIISSSSFNCEEKKLKPANSASNTTALEQPTQTPTSTTNQQTMGEFISNTETVKPSSDSKTKFFLRKTFSGEYKEEISEPPDDSEGIYYRVTYDEQDRIIKEEEFQNDAVYRTTITTYYVNGNKKSHELYYEKDIPREKEFYDEQTGTRIIRRETFHGGVFAEVVEYDEQDRVSLLEEYHYNGRIESRLTFYEGRPLNNEYYDRQGNRTDTWIERDKKGRELKRTTYEKGEVKDVYVHAYWDDTQHTFLQDHHYIPPLREGQIAVCHLAPEGEAGNLVPVAEKCSIVSTEVRPKQSGLEG